MARSQEDSITTLLGLKGHEVGKVSENEGEITVEAMVSLCGTDMAKGESLCYIVSIRYLSIVTIQASRSLRG